MFQDTEGNYIVVQGEETIQDSSTSQYVVVEDGTVLPSDTQQSGAELVTSAGEPSVPDGSIIRVSRVCNTFLHLP